MKKKVVGGFVGLSVGYVIGIIILQFLMFGFNSTGNFGLSPETMTPILIYGPKIILIVFSLIGIIMGIRVAKAKLN